MHALIIPKIPGLTENFTLFQVVKIPGVFPVFHG